MRTTKIIEITGNEILQDYISQALYLTTAEYNQRFGNNMPEVFWDIKETGDHDKGTYNRFLKGVYITIEE